MSTLTRKQVLLSPDNILKLRQWSKIYHLSEAELVRRAIQAYQPDAPVSLECEKELVQAMLAQMKESLTSAIAVVYTTRSSAV